MNNEVCKKCGIVSPTWFTDSDIWKVLDESGILCPICFINLAEQKGIRTTAWNITPEERLLGTSQRDKYCDERPCDWRRADCSQLGSEIDRKWYCVNHSPHTAEFRRRLADLESENRNLRYELRQERGSKALLENGMPPTGNPDFDKILDTHPIAAMIQRGWLPGITGFDDLPALESAICHFWGVKTIAEAVDPPILVPVGKDAK